MQKRRRITRVVSSVAVLSGLALVAFKVAADGEPGAVPLLLIAAGVSGFLLAPGGGAPQD